MSGYRRAPEPEEIDENFVPIARPVDEVEASLLEQALQEDGIPCRVIGSRVAALVGATQNVMPLRLEVPASMVAAAEEIVEAFRNAPPLPEGEEEDDEEDEVERDEHDAPVAASERRKVVLAMGAVMLFFGGSHFYARRPWTAGILAITQLSALLMLRGADFPDRPLAGVAVVTFLAVDVVFGVRAALAFNRGVRPSIQRQLVDGVALALAVVTISALVVLRQA